MNLKKYVMGAMIGLLSLPLSAADLTIASFGGSYSDFQQRYMVGPFAQASGLSTELIDFSGGTDPIAAQIKAGKVEWDVINIESIDLTRACAEGLLERLPAGLLPAGADGVAANKDFMAEAIASPCGVGTIVWSVVYAYNHNTIGEAAPLTIADFFDTRQFPGRRALREKAQVNLEWALMADGVKPADVYQVLGTVIGQQRAFSKLDLIKSDIVWFDGWSDVPKLLDEAEVVLAQTAHARAYDMVHNEAKPLTVVWDANVYDVDAWAIVKGSSNRARAEEFIAFATATEPLASMSELAFSPVRTSANRLVAEAVLPSSPIAHMDEGLLASGLFWAEHGAVLNQKFADWLQR